MKNNLKKLFAVLLTVALVAAMFVVPTQAQDVTVSDIASTLVTNGNFEVGVEGMTPYGWHMTSTESNLKLVDLVNEPARDWKINYSLKTKTDGGDFSAELSKNGTGYSALTTTQIKVQGGATYRLSYDYKTTQLKIRDGGDISDCYGIRPTIQQFNANGELLGADGNVTADHLFVDNLRSTQRIGREVTDDYLTDIIEFSVFPNTESIILYINIGGQAALRYTVLFDNISLYKYNDYELVNGDFEGATEDLDAGRVTTVIDGPANWYMVSCEQGPSNGPNSSDWYTAYVPILQQDETGNRYMKVHGRYTDADGNYTTRGYNLIQSDFVKVIPGGTLDLSYKFKSDELRVTTHSAQAVLWYFDANKNYISGASYSYSMGTAAVLEWTDYKIATRTIPTNAVYVKVGFYYGSTWNAVNGAFYFDDVELTMESAAARNNLNLVTINVNGYPRPENFTANFSILNGGDVNHPEYVRVGPKLSQATNSNEGAVGAIMAYSDQLIDVTPGERIQIGFDYKIVGYDKAMERHIALGGTSSAIGEPPTIKVRFYDADGNIFYYGANGSVTSSTGGIFGAGALRRADCDWSHASGSFTVPEGAVQMEWGYYMNCGNAKGSAHVNHYYDNVVVKSASDPYWLSKEYLTKDETNLFGLVFLAEGDANNDGIIDLYDLVRMNNKINDDTVTVADGADMNKTGNVNAEDTQLLKWKLLGIDSEEKLDGAYSGTAYSILKGKSAVFFGDSITWNEGISWAYKIEDYGVYSTKAGVSGASVSTIRANRIITQLHGNQNPGYDYVVLHGGVNDAMSNGPIGEMSASFDLADFDTSTYAGALEEMFYYAHEYYPNSKIGYIVNYAVPLSATDANGKLGNYFAVGKQICEKWNIPYIDLYSGIVPGTEDVTYSDLIDVNNPDSIYFPSAGDVHTNEAGYEVLTPHIADWMTTLTDNVDPR